MSQPDEQDRAPNEGVRGGSGESHIIFREVESGGGIARGKRRAHSRATPAGPKSLQPWTSQILL